MQDPGKNMVRRFILILLIAALSLFIGYRFWPEERLSPEARAEAILVVKDRHELKLLRSGKPLKTYRISLGPEPVGHKERKGDFRTPEGLYFIDRRNPKSIYYRSLHISYPSKKDRRRAKRLGVNPGGDITIHGLPNGWAWVGRWHRFLDWTRGCIAVTNEEMDEIWRAVPDLTPIEILP
jgi:murein L,D-transpeptidase YafK